MNVERLWEMPNDELLEVLRAGYPVPRPLRGSWRGVSLGLPRIVERATWKVFRKEFDDARGHNVRLDQGAPLVPVRSGPRPPPVKAFGPFEVRELGPNPFGCERGLLLDYAATHPRWHPLSAVRDIVVAVHDDSTELLLGAMWVELGRPIRTPSFFTLERELPPT